MLMTMSGKKFPENVRLSGTLHGDCGYYTSNKYTLYCTGIGLHTFNTVKCSAEFPYVFGSTKYKSARIQHQIKECGPMGM